jgi:signal transduction histidine kinase
VLYGVLTVDAAGVPHPEEEALVAISAAARVPVFSLFEHQLGKGSVGGPLVSLSRVGDAMADSALRILSGEATGELPREDASTPYLLYDWRQLERWKIPESRLPAGSMVRYRPTTLWEQHAGLFMTGLGIILAQLVLLIVLALQRTRLKAAESETRHLSTRLLSANEDERRRLARDLHDDFSHRLARLSFDAAELERADKRETPRIVHNLRQELSHLAQDIHDVSHRLHPTTLEDLGLADALRTECEQLSRSAELRIAVDVDELPGVLPPDIALCAFRVAQEALRNVSRHARATNVTVSVGVAGSSLHLAVRDNGIGFDPDLQHGLAGLGHASMRERVRLLGGVLHIQSAPGDGTMVSTSLPLAAGLA